MTDYAKQDFIKKHKRHAHFLGWIIVIIVLAVFILGFFSLANRAIVKNEISQCDTLVQQSKDFTNGAFYITPDEKAMCDSHHIAINAPVYNADDCVNGVSDTTPRCQISQQDFTKATSLYYDTNSK